MTPLERAARAICTVRNENPDDSSAVWGARWREYAAEVRAVFTALREPSDSMIEAGLDVGPDHDPEHYYRAMIDAALSEVDDVRT